MNLWFQAPPKGEEILVNSNTSSHFSFFSNSKSKKMKVLCIPRWCLIKNLFLRPTDRVLMRQLKMLDRYPSKPPIWLPWGRALKHACGLGERTRQSPGSQNTPAETEINSAILSQLRRISDRVDRLESLATPPSSDWQNQTFAWADKEKDKDMCMEGDCQLTIVGRWN